MTENQNPEQKARDTIDALLKQAGWVVQSARKIDLNAGLGIAVREYQTDVGPADYALFVDKKALGIVEAKKEELGHKITEVELQTAGYAAAKLKWVNNKEPLPFLYESTGIITRFTDGRDPKPRSREVFSFHRPETLKEWLSQGESLRARLHHIPPLNPDHLPAKELRLRDCQEIAITNLEESFKADRPRALIQMATGAGKTYTAITSIYRLLKHAHGKRILFLVDTKNLGEQAEQEMMSYVPLDDNRKFTELYNVQRLKSSFVAKDTPSAVSAKTHYVIVDAIGVTRSLKTASQPLITKPTVPLKDLAMSVMMGATDEDTVSSLAGRLARLNKQLDTDDQRRIREASGGLELTQLVGKLFGAIDADNIEARALELAKQPIGSDPGDDKRQQAQQQLVSEVAKVLNGELVELIDTIRQDKEQTIDHDTLDNLVGAGWEKNIADNAQAIADEFTAYLKANQDNIAALTIFFSQPYRRRELSYDLIRQVLDKLKIDKPRLAPLYVWQAYRRLDDYKGMQPVKELTALVTLIRRVCGMDETLTDFDATVRRNFRNWIMKHHSGGSEKFNEEQMDWLRMVRDHVANSFHIERDDLEMSPFDGQGGLGRMYQLFGAKMDTLLDEMNEVLVA